ncbi:MAG: N-methyl-L-tryptophan oxidase [Deinococcales bacterium]
MKTFDIAVIGAGLVGASTAYSLAKAGKHVVLFEQFNFLHERGSSHGASRIFRYTYEDVRYIDMCLAAYKAWQLLEQETDDRLLFPAGDVDIGDAKTEGFLAEIAQNLAARALDYRYLSLDETRKRFPAFKLHEGHIILYQKDAAVLAASRAINSLLQVSARQGAVLKEQERILNVSFVEDAVELKSTKGEYRVKKLILAAGAWTGKILNELAISLKPEKQQSLFVRIPQAKGYQLGEMPIFFERSFGIYGFPSFERPFAIKVGDHYDAPSIDPDNRSFELDRDIADKTLQHLQQLLHIENHVLDGLTCIYTQSPDQHFILDRHPKHPQMVIAAGFSGHGFKFGPVLGDILMALAYEQEANLPFDLSLFKLARLL